MRTPCLLLPLLLCSSAVEVPQTAQTIREYFIAAVEIGWDYIHLDDGDRASRQSGSFTPIPQKHIKAVYREYKDATFTVPRPRPAWTGGYLLHFFFKSHHISIYIT
ncbi:hypothetical protein XENORESO_003809 [Xenotaenia resolanae]|uniref:Uncharacterized protein n=1 Tax=Xenotaenia resolanae TaxID=208358 RepID=A0ABV0X742_9TELE